jgi:uncharacterized DUF497 family protein
MRLAWDEHKRAQDLRKHQVRLETVLFAFDEPYARTQRDVSFDDEGRWITPGAIGPGSILLDVHAF